MRTKKPNAKDLRIAELSAESGMYQEALLAHLTGRAIWIDRRSCEGETVSASLINPLRAHGGLVLLLWKVKDQNPTVSVHNLERIAEDYRRKLTGAGLEGMGSHLAEIFDRGCRLATRARIAQAEADRIAAQQRAQKAGESNGE